MKERTRNAVRTLLVLSASLLLAWTQTNAALFKLDDFSVTLNDSPIFHDTFEDGNPPPDAPDYENGDPALYVTTGAYPAEADGKLTIDTDLGVDTLAPDGRPISVTATTLWTPTNNSDPLALGIDDTFEVSGIYDLVMPDRLTERYRVAFTDRVMPQGPGDTTNDDLRLAVATVGPEYALYDEVVAELDYEVNGPIVVVELVHLDFVNDTVTPLAATLIDKTGNPDQIKLTLAKTDPGGNLITASYAYLKDGVEINNGVLTTTTTDYGLFHSEEFTHANFSTVYVTTGQPIQNVAELVTGSPVSLQQNVSTPATPFALGFDYLFETTTGELSIYLDNTLLDSIIAPSTLQPDFMTASIPIDTPLLNLADIPLKFELDGPTGSTLLLDDIMFPDLANGDFQAGTLTAWSTTTTGTGTVGATRAQVPEPTTLALFGIGLAGLGFVKRRRMAG